VNLTTDEAFVLVLALDDWLDQYEQAADRDNARLRETSALRNRLAAFSRSPEANPA